MPDIKEKGQCDRPQQGQLDEPVESRKDERDESCGTCGPSDVSEGDKESERES
jgi:hypothetical protein